MSGPFTARAGVVPDEVDCPKCGLRVGTEVVRGRYRIVTTTVVHIKKGSPTATVCHAILQTKETPRDRTP